MELENVVTRDLELSYPLTVSCTRLQCQVPPELSRWLLLPICISSTNEEGEGSCGGSVAQTNHHVFLKPTPSTPMVPAHQGLQGPDQVVRNLQEEAALSGQTWQ